VGVAGRATGGFFLQDDAAATSDTAANTINVGRPSRVKSSLFIIIIIVHRRGPSAASPSYFDQSG
jgi:hypothetical protein